MQNFTKEQLEIIKSNTNKIRINALAGHGKTYTLIQKCIWHIKQASENKKILFIVFNESIKQATKKSFEQEFKKNFGKYKSKTMLSCIQIKTTYEMAQDILKEHIGHFEITKFDNLDIKNFLDIKTKNNYSKQDIQTIQKKLNKYYNLSTTITQQLKNEIKNSFTQEEKENIAYIYEGVITIINAQTQLLFNIDNDACLKLVTSIDIDDIYYDMVIIDEAQDTNAFIFKIFLDIKSNIKIISGDTFSHIFAKEKSINTFNTLDGFIDFYLSESMRMPKRACDNANKILYKLSRKTKTIGKDKDFETNLSVINKNKPTYIYRDKTNMLNSIYKSALDSQKIYIVDGFINQYKDFLAMCYIQSDFDKDFLKISTEINSISEKLLKFQTLSNYIELTNNETHRAYYALIRQWHKSENKLIDRINLLKSQYTNKEAEADISYTLVQNAKARDFEYTVIANDFIDHTKIQNPTDKQTQELHLLYIAMTRCKLGLYRQSLS